MSDLRYTVQEVGWCSEGPSELLTYDDAEKAFPECDRLESLLSEDSDIYYQVVASKLAKGEVE